MRLRRAIAPTTLLPCALGAGLALSALGAARTHAPDPADELFQGTNVLRISITIPDEGVRELSHAGARRSQPKPKAQATVTEAGRTYTNVSVQLKGFTTFRPIHRGPSLTLNFERNSPKQLFHGLAKISLNNSLQDRTRLNEKFSRELFAAAGVPVPRADYALLTLNGRELGLYVLTEGYDREFLKRHFARHDGNLYEGGILRDIDAPLQLNTGKAPAADARVRQLIAATREPDPVRRLQAVRDALDLERFLSMMAMETILCHSDSYSMNRNNYRIYHDPATDKLVFMPHGMDRVLGTHRSFLDLSVVPPVLGMVAAAILSTPEGRRLHVERVATFSTNLFHPDALCRRAQEIDARIASAKLISGEDSPSNPSQPAGRQGSDADELCERIAKRAADLRLQLARLPDLLLLPRTLTFAGGSLEQINDWTLRPKAGQPDVAWQNGAPDGNAVARGIASAGPMRTSVRSRVKLPAGRYRLEGRPRVTNDQGPARVVSLALLRHSGSRFDEDLSRLPANPVRFEFQVDAARAPEEVEFICDIRDSSSHVWFDPSLLHLVREGN
jgi:hypothetical protein